MKCVPMEVLDNTDDLCLPILLPKRELNRFADRIRPSPLSGGPLIYQDR